MAKYMLALSLLLFSGFAQISIFAQDTERDSSAFTTIKPRIYAGVIGEAKIVAVPKTSLGLLSLNDNAFINLAEPETFDQAIPMGGGGVLFGYILRPGKVSDSFGDNMRLEFTGQSSFGKADKNYSYDTVGGNFLDAFNIDGSGLGPNLGSAGIATASRSLEVTETNVSITIKSDYEIAKGVFTLTPKAGLQFVYESNDSSLNASGNANSMNLEEEIESVQFGPVLGVRLTGHLARDMQIYAEPSVALLVAQNHYEGKQNYSNGSAFKVKDSDTEFAPRMGLILGWKRQISDWTLGLEGGGEYRLNAASVQYPTVPVGQDISIPNTTTSTHLDSASAGAGFFRIFAAYSF